MSNSMRNWCSPNCVNCICNRSMTSDSDLLDGNQSNQKSLDCWHFNCWIL